MIAIRTRKNPRADEKDQGKRENCRSRFLGRVKRLHSSLNGYPANSKE